MKRTIERRQKQSDMKNNFTKRAAQKSKTNPNFASHAPPPVKVQPIDKCRSNLLDKLSNLKDNHTLRYSLIPEVGYSKTYYNFRKSKLTFSFRTPLLKYLNFMETVSFTKG